MDYTALKNLVDVYGLPTGVAVLVGLLGLLIRTGFSLSVKMDVGPKR
jgi:hypothetical protein